MRRVRKNKLGWARAALLVTIVMVSLAGMVPGQAAWREERGIGGFVIVVLHPKEEGSPIPTITGGGIESTSGSVYGTVYK
ncbi:MAG: hypothetical protein D9V47_09595 [Clostridia bacterium]|nr:MAG: hypothetical protein D9V47_09595 [Clostridia bacterium]